ncbi:hypothetical protein ACHAW5_001715 [Stephanodiscus triporus]|uniref:Uncharacterized protein n=1 Tax=Stephanodiscus triporus TaxID=2934178 RepID=A0ABD3P1T1_9STRA
MVLIVDFPRSNGIPIRLRHLDRHVHPPSPPARSRRSRWGVSFADEPEVANVTNLAIDHKSDLWFSQNEMESIKRTTLLALQKIVLRLQSLEDDQRGASADDENIRMDIADEVLGTYIGLERYLSPSVCVDVQRRRRSLWDAMRFEQDRQDRAGICDPDLLANIAEVETDWSTRRARVIGLQHERIRRRHRRRTTQSSQYD